MKVTGENDGTVFSARLYGSRSNKNKKLLEDIQKAVEEE